MAANKPSGQPTIPARGETPEALNRELERELGRKIFVVHRLDRDASGLVLFAKDADAHHKLSLLFSRREIHKTYLALVLGEVAEDGEVDRPLRTFGSGRVGEDAKGKASLTRYRVKERFLNATLLEVEPVTGRKHQIRAHLALIGHPILGDARYGRERPVGGAPRLMLHSRAARFKLGRAMFLEAEPGEDFLAVLASRR